MTSEADSRTLNRERYLREQRIQAAKGHVHRIVLSGHIAPFLHVVHPGEPRWLSILNSRAARVVANVLSSMYFFWFCVALDVAELPSVIQSGSVVIWVGYASQTVIQLLALPALGAYAKLNQQLQDKQATAQGETLDAIHLLTDDVHSINKGQNIDIAEALLILRAIAKRDGLDLSA